MNAISIYQGMLDTVSQAVMTNDFDAYVSCICLPYVIRTHTAVFTLHVEADLRDMLQNLHQGLHQRGVTDYVRIARTARFSSYCHIEGLHFTHMLRDGERIAAPHSASQSLILSGTAWRFIEARYAIENDTLPIVFPQLGPDSDMPPQHVDPRVDLIA